MRDYLACPVSALLSEAPTEARRHCADWAEELDGAGFGNLLHDVLRDFSRGTAADSESGDAIRDELFVTLGQLAAERFGEEPLPAVRVQVEMLRLRLEKSSPSFEGRTAKPPEEVEDSEVELAVQPKAM